MRWQTEEVAVQKLAITAKAIAVDTSGPPSSPHLRPRPTMLRGDRAGRPVAPRAGLGSPEMLEKGESLAGPGPYDYLYEEGTRHWSEIQWASLSTRGENPT
jgi:hypothetical protein